MLLLRFPSIFLRRSTHVKVGPFVSVPRHSPHQAQSGYLQPPNLFSFEALGGGVGKGKRVEWHDAIIMASPSAPWFRAGPVTESEILCC